MRILYKELFDGFHRLHLDIVDCIESLSQEELDWKPGPEMNSIGVLVTHLAGAERYWIGDVVLQDPSGRDREAEFRTQGLDAAILMQRLEDIDVYTRTALERLSLRDLETFRSSPRDGQRFTVAWALAHALEHTAIHAGHIQMTSQLSRQKKK
jgi:uncharacterized damage-inducible protein DinB